MREETERKAIVFDLVRNSYVDGPGIRTTVFFKGCNLACAWCHNPEGQAPAVQLMFFKNRCTGCGKCREKCPHELQKCDLCGTCALYCPADARKLCGRKVSVDDLMKEVLKDRALYERSGGGVTASGGECMLQIDFLEDFLRAAKRRGVHTAVDTAGQVPFSSFRRILPQTDLFLYDVKCMDSEKHRRMTGVGNERILANLKKLFSAGARVWVRIPLIAGINDGEEEIGAICRFLRENGPPERVELLPYHGMGEHKYAALSRPVPSFSAPEEERTRRLNALIQEAL